MVPRKLLVSLCSLSWSFLVSSSPLSRPPTQQTYPCAFDSSTSPQCWGDFSLDTNYYDQVPNTGVTREYWLELQNTTTAAVDGVERIVLTMNGTIPGPTLFADWGDEVVVHVRNGLRDNGTSIHFHGVRQLGTNQMDGTNAIQQCPVAPGDTFTHRFRASQYGHSWYHSHFAVQAWNGVFGGIVINGPASAPYDVDMGVLMLNDWFHDTTDYLWATVARAGVPPGVKNGLINGTNVYNLPGAAGGGGGGKRFETAFEKGKRYRFRLVNSALDTHFKFSIDNHSMTVMAADFVPLVPYQTAVLSIGIGQRYDVVVEADQEEDSSSSSSSYWMRAIPAAECSGANESADNIRGIIRYAPSTADPTSLAHSGAFKTDCGDEPLASLVPYLRLDASAPASTQAVDIDFDAEIADGGLRKWTINGDDFRADWDAPTLQQGLLLSNSSFSFGGNGTSGIARVRHGGIHAAPAGAGVNGSSWVYFVIENDGAHAPPISHPIHLHGHDFFVLAQQPHAKYSGDGTTALQLENPPRRDTAMLPAGGFLVLGFVTDNPGVWPLHCHIGWHVSQGFAFQTVEREDEIAGITDLASINAVCDRWKAYAAANGIVQDDSGI
ncbi:multicopper oxidase [Xylariaceae sp. FL0594]|nr:multicopper oxidase [Xylariaceae sp. FL0594]